MPDIHPTSEQIRDFSSGSLSNEDLHRVADHIAQCKSCLSAMELMPDDTLVDLLRSKPSTRNSPLRLGAGYVLERELGRGGMGVVYLAFQPALDRQVALKMITQGSIAEPSELARFRREAQTAASLKHPYIAQVYDVGDQDGQPYIAMELITGPTLATVLKSGPLDHVSATQLFIRLADAVGHAHSRGVVHRDLKPSNILLEAEADGQWKPKIVDFGLAKQNDASGAATATGMLLGTPKYMSPEQASGDNKQVGETSDVHALGVILYETLTGICPYEGSNPIEILEQVCNSDAVRPRALRPSVPRDLETICLKCLEKKPADRYPNANEFRQDLLRFSEQRPIHARPTHWTTKVTKAIKRNPTITAIIACVGTGVIGLLVTSLLYNRLLSRALNEQRTESARANENFSVAFGAIDKMLERVGFDQLANQPGMEKVREELLGDAVELYSSLLSMQPAETQRDLEGREKGSEMGIKSRSQYATALSKLGRIQTLLGHKELAQKNLELAIKIQQETVSQFPDRHDLINELALSHMSLGRVDQQTNEFQKAINLMRPMKDTFPSCRVNLASALNQLAIPLLPQQREAIQLEVLELARSLIADNPNDPNVQNTLGQVLHNLGLLYHRAGRADKANDFISEALKQFETLVTTHEGVFEYQNSLAESLAVIASIRFLEDQWEEGKKSMDRSTAIRQLLVVRYPNLPALIETLSRSYQTHAGFLIQSQQMEPAIELATKGVGLAEQLNQENPSDHTQWFLAASQTILATALGGNYQISEATDVGRSACDIFEELLEKSDHDYRIEAGVAFMNHSNLLRAGSTDEALRLGDRAVDLLTAAYEKDWTRTDLRLYVFNANGARAQTLEALQRYCEAADAWKKTIELSTPQAETLLQINYALCSVRCGRPEPALSTARMVMIRQDLDGMTLYNLACLFGLLCQSESSKAFDCAYLDTAFELLNHPTIYAFLREEAHFQQLKNDADLSSLRDDPRFEAVIKGLTKSD